jgi:uncharacterized membrane protein YgcG
MTLSDDPGRVFEREIEAWKLSAITSSDTDVWQRAFAKLVSVMFDGLSTSCVQKLVRASGEGVQRKFTLTDLPEAELRVEALKFRSLVAAARALLGILRVQARADTFVNGKKALLIRTAHKTPVGAHVAATILDKEQRNVPGQVLPRNAEFASCDFPAWWACVLASTPAQGFCAAMTSLFEDAVVLWADRNRKVVCDELTWTTLHGRTTPSSPGKRTDGDRRHDAEPWDDYEGDSQRKRRRGPRAGRNHAGPDTTSAVNLHPAVVAPTTTSLDGGRGGGTGGRGGRGRDGRGGGRDGRGRGGRGRTG